MTPTRWKPAVTVAAVIEQGGRFLLVEEDTSEGVRWNQPAGHLEPGESLLDAVARETLEESAHPFVAEGLLGIYLAEGDTTFLRFAFVGTVGQPLAQPLDAGIRRAFWASADEVRAHPERHRSDFVMRCIDDYLRARQLRRPWLPLEALAYLGPDAASRVDSVTLTSKARTQS